MESNWQADETFQICLPLNKKAGISAGLGCWRNVRRDQYFDTTGAP
jgi:hypothetical protein